MRTLAAGQLGLLKPLLCCMHSIKVHRCNGRVGHGTVDPGPRLDRVPPLLLVANRSPSDSIITE